MRYGRTLIAACLSGLAGFVLAAIVVAIVDLYLAGHARSALGSRLFADVPRYGIHLSVADALALSCGLVCALVGGALATRRSTSP